MNNIFRRQEDMAAYLEGQADGMLWAIEQGLDPEQAAVMTANALRNAAASLRDRS